jgi:phage tail-like protein
MAKFNPKTQRRTPYANFKFQVFWNPTGPAVAGMSKMTGLKRTTEVIEYREGGDQSTTFKAPGRTKYDAITLERGVTHDTEFETWAGKVWLIDQGLGRESSLQDFRRNIYVALLNEAGQKVLAYNIWHCWVSEYQAFPDFDANANAIAIQHIKLECEGWSRDTTFGEPAEPTFVVPTGA